jgi:Microtubule-binding stalk of dynein motor
VFDSWEDARVLLIRDNFFLELVYFDKSQLAPSAAKRLAEYCSDPSFTPDSVRLVSVAAAHVCQWLQALNAYSRRKDNIRPTMQKLLDTESEMKRVICHVFT